MRTVAENSITRVLKPRVCVCVCVCVCVDVPVCVCVCVCVCVLLLVPQKKSKYFKMSWSVVLFFAIAPAQAETLLHGLERAAAGIGLHVNAHKTEYMCFNPTGDISTQNSRALKLVDKFTYQGSNVSSTETDIDTRLAKAWTANDRQSVIWKSDLTDEIKRRFSKQGSCRYCCMDAQHGH